MAYLYKNYKGDEVSNHSFSSGSDFRFCRQKYYLKKLLGWREKDDTAAAKFGIAFESAIQFFHANGLKSGSGVDEFKRLWLLWKDNISIVYKEKEGDWVDFYKMGSQMMALYEKMLPTLPVIDPAFQMQLKREVFPGSALAGISDVGYVDMLSRAPWSHPFLPKVEIPAGAAYRPLIIDIKTSGKELDETPGILALDPQLARYAWLSCIPDVAFLWGRRSKPDSFEKGTEVTFLESSGKWTVLDKGIVWEYRDENQTLLIATSNGFSVVKEEFSKIKGKGSKERQVALIQSYLENETLSEVPVDVVTKQRLQFSAVRISPEDILETGQVVAKEIVEIHDANQKNFWPKDGKGIRFPRNSCVWCSYRGICTRNNELRDSLLVQIKPIEPEKDWLTELEEED